MNLGIAIATSSGRELTIHHAVLSNSLPDDVAIAIPRFIYM
jgi:hypothetical protein